MRAVYRRELQGYFLSPIAYVFIGIFMLVSGIFFAMTNVLSQQADFNGMLGNLTFLFMLIVPVLTMKLLSEERKNKTDQLLLTAPVSLVSIVVGKYLAAVTVFLVTLVVSAIYPITLFLYGNPSLVEILNGYLGFFLLGSALIAVGLLMSGLSENQVTAAVSTFGVLLLLWLGGDVLSSLISVDWINSVLDWFSVYNRFQNFTAGLLSITQVIYYISFSAVFVFLTIRLLESRRWREV